MADIRPWLGGVQAAEFLAQCWQRQPQFFSAALPELPATPDWRALAARDDVETRRIVTTSAAGYLCSTGPYSGPDPVDPWTVLIQDADVHAPQLARLFDALPFLPRWRHEDIMMSVAVAGGSVGPHVDRYDVFLVQAVGERQWQVGHRDTGVPDPAHTELRLVQPFAADFAVTAQPGDVLYLPPGVPHHGIASNDCVTYSIGFRAPPLHELAAVLLTHLDTDALLGDADRLPASDALLLDRATVHTARDQLRALLDDEQALARALGELVTEPKDWLVDAADDAPVAGPLRLAATARLAVWDDPQAPCLFANGAAYPLDHPDAAAVVARLRRAQPLDPAAHAGAAALIEALVEAGVLESTDETDT